MSDDFDIDNVDDYVIVDEVFQRGLEKQVIEEFKLYNGDDFVNTLTKSEVEYIINCIEKENKVFSVKKTQLLDSLYEIQRNMRK